MAFERYRKRIGEEEAKQQDEFMKKLCDDFNKSDLNEPVAVNKITSLEMLHYIEEHMGQPGFYFDLGMPFDEYKRKVEEAYEVNK